MFGQSKPVPEKLPVIFFCHEPCVDICERNVFTDRVGELSTRTNTSVPHGLGRGAGNWASSSRRNSMNVKIAVFSKVSMLIAHPAKMYGKNIPGNCSMYRQNSYALPGRWLQKFAGRHKCFLVINAPFLLELLAHHFSFVLDYIRLSMSLVFEHPI